VDAVSVVVFLSVTLLFAFILTWLLKFTAFRYVPWAMSLPWYWWVILITLGAFALQGLGVPVSEGYSAFFKWLSSVLGGGL